MLRGIVKNVSFVFFFTIFISFLGQSEAQSKTIIRYDINLSCADNAVAPLNSIKKMESQEKVKKKSLREQLEEELKLQ